MSAKRIDSLIPPNIRIQVFTRKRELIFEGISIRNTTTGVYLVAPEQINETYAWAEWFPFNSQELQLVLV